MNWIYKNHELKTSGCYNMNFLFNNGKFYIMDNHLAAAWCWLQKQTHPKDMDYFILTDTMIY